MKGTAGDPTGLARGTGLTLEGIGKPPSLGVHCWPLVRHAARTRVATLASESPEPEVELRRMPGDDPGAPRHRQQSRPVSAAQPIAAQDGGGHAPSRPRPSRGASPPALPASQGLRGVA